MPQKRKRKKKNNRFNALQEKISLYSKHITIPNNLNSENVDIGTNIDVIVKTSNCNFINKKFNLNNDRLMNDPIKTIQYTLYPTKDQKKVLQQWFLAYIDMYNFIIGIIKDKFRESLKIDNKAKLIDLDIDLNITYLKKISGKTKNKLNNKYNINMHILDYAINDAIAMYKSKISNLKNGHIKKSKLRYLKRTKKTKIIKIENMLCTENSFCTSELGKKISVVPNLNFKNDISMTAIVQYNKRNDTYCILVRKQIISDYINSNVQYEIDITRNNDMIKTSKEYMTLIKTSKMNVNIDNVKTLNKKLDNDKRRITKKKTYDNKSYYKNKKSKNKKDLAIDIGLNTFITALSNDHILEIGKKVSKTIKKTLKYMDRLEQNKYLSKKLKEKIKLRTENRLNNRVTDYHWKIIDYLTSNYRHIIIGNFSTKQMGESDIDKLIKRIGNKIKLYKFKQRLQYKCYLNGVKYKETDEYCTSKCCSTCGHFKKDLGSNKIYNCKKCGLVIGRDINASKNIYMKEIK